MAKLNTIVEMLGLADAVLLDDLDSNNRERILGFEIPEDILCFWLLYDGHVYSESNVYMKLYGFRRCLEDSIDYNLLGGDERFLILGDNGAGEAIIFRDGGGIYVADFTNPNGSAKFIRDRFSDLFQNVSLLP